MSKLTDIAKDLETDNVNHPQHYEGHTSLECIECMRVAMGRTAVYNFCLCNSFKYLWRYKNKNGREDINKAGWYLDYVKHDIERDGKENVPLNICEMYDRLNDLYIDIVDKLSNTCPTVGKGV